MPVKSFSRAALVAALCLVLVVPAQAGNYRTDGELLLVGIIAVSAAVGVLLTVLILHHNQHNAAITGCVSSGPGGLRLADEKDHRTYKLTGDTTAIKAGDRMSLRGNRMNDGDSFVFQTWSVRRDFGACRP